MVLGTEGFTPGGAVYSTLELDATNTPYVTYRDDAFSGKATAKRFNGSSWVTLGSEGFSAGEIQDPNLLSDAQGTLYVVYSDASLGSKAIMKKFDPKSATWVTVGPEGFTTGIVTYLTFAMDRYGVPYVVFRDDTQGGKLTVMQYN